MDFNTLYREIVDFCYAKFSSYDEDGQIYYMLKNEPEHGSREYYSRTKAANGIPIMAFYPKKGEGLDRLYESETFVIKDYTSHGAHGGSCWGDEAHDFYNEPPKNFNFNNIVTDICIQFCPELNFLAYQKILDDAIMEYETTCNEYYGNYSMTKHIGLNLYTLAKQILPHISK